MNTLLKTIAVICATGFPVAFSAESFGITLPEAINAAHMFGAFVVAVTFLTMLTDYTGARPVGSPKSVAAPAKPASRTTLPLAA